MHYNTRWYGEHSAGEMDANGMGAAEEEDNNIESQRDVNGKIE